MICERCQRESNVEFIVPDDVWDRLSPYGDARGVLCIECADELAAQAGLSRIEIEVAFYGRALHSRNSIVSNELTTVMYRSAAAARGKKWP